MQVKLSGKNVCWGDRREKRMEQRGDEKEEGLRTVGLVRCIHFWCNQRRISTRSHHGIYHLSVPVANPATHRQCSTHVPSTLVIDFPSLSYHHSTAYLSHSLLSRKANLFRKTYQSLLLSNSLPVSSLFKLNFIFYWNRVALQCCVSFCCPRKRISYMYPYISSLLDLPPIPPFHSSRSPPSTESSFLCLITGSHSLTSWLHLHRSSHGCFCQTRRTWIQFWMLSPQFLLDLQHDWTHWSPPSPSEDFLPQLLWFPSHLMGWSLSVSFSFSSCSWIYRSGVEHIRPFY